MNPESIYNQMLAQAWEELVGRWEGPLLYYIRRMVDDESEAWQVLQETWLDVVRNLPTLRLPEYFPKWLYRICRRKIITYYRRHRRESEFHEPAAGPPAGGEPEPDLRLENAEAVHWGLGRLRPVYREVLTLFFLQDLSVDEIAEVLSVPAGTVKSRLYHARRQLRTLLEDD